MQNLVKRGHFALMAALSLTLLAGASTLRAQESDPAAAAPPAAESGGADTAPASDAKLEDLVGKWLVLVLLPEGPQVANIDVQGDANGVTATLVSPLGENVIDDIALEDGAHVMTYMMDLGGQPMDIQVLATVNGETLAGTILVGGGAMELNIEGAKEGTDAAATLQARADAAMAALAAGTAPTTESLPAAAPPAAEAASTTESTAAPASPAPATEPASQPAAEAAAPAAPAPPASDRDVARATIGAATVAVDYGRPSTDGPGYQRMAQGVPDGFIWRLGKNAATRLETSAKLKFGETVIEPGEYGLWARRSGDHWDLILSRHARVWGVPYRPDGEIATVPMSSAKSETKADLLTITLAPSEKGGTINVHWGDEIGTIAFEVLP